MGADSLAENAPEFICPICLPKPKSSGFQCKKTSFDILSPCNFPLKVSRDTFDKSAYKVTKCYGKSNLRLQYHFGPIFLDN